MHHYRQALLLMRQGDSDREIAGARLMGRPKAAQWRRIATERGWLDPARLPDDEAIAAALGSPRKASTTISTLESYRELLGAWVEQAVSGTAIHAALKRQNGWAGSYSEVRRLVADIGSQLPRETACRLDFDPGDAAQVDFDAGPTLIHPDGLPRRTWAFVMTLANSRHQCGVHLEPDSGLDRRSKPARSNCAIEWKPKEAGASFRQSTEVRVESGIVSLPACPSTRLTGAAR